MAYKYEISKHAVCTPSKVLAREGGKHIYNIELTTDADNGNFVKKGDFIDIDRYAEDVATTVDMVVLQKAANGNWYVEVVSETDALLVYTDPVTVPEWTKEFAAESTFFNGKGEVARCYELAKGDVFEVSADAFDGTPAAKAEIKTIAAKKLVIAKKGE